MRFDELSWAKDFAKLQGALWPKYLQAGLNEMYYSDKQMKQTRIRLADEEFGELPSSHLNNLSDYELFADYLQADMHIEVARALKHHLMPFVCDRVTPGRRTA